MSWDLNQVALIGRLTKDPELRYGQSGVAYCPLSLAINRKSFKEGANDEVYFIDIVTFGKTAEIAGQYLAKGKQIAVQGYLSQRRWEDQNGQKHNKIEVVADRIQFLGAPTGGGSNQYSNEGSRSYPQPNQNIPQESNDFDVPFPEDDEIPF